MALLPCFKMKNFFRRVALAPGDFDGAPLDALKFLAAIFMVFDHANIMIFHLAYRRTFSLSTLLSSPSV